MADSRYKIVYRSGIALDAWTAQLWDKLKARFPKLILTQGVNSGAVASAGTHRGLGVLDLYLGGHAWRDVLRYAFDIGFFGWYRPELPGVWKTHIHLGVRGCIKAAASLKAQFTSWLRRRNGLKGDGPDPFTYRPKNASKAAPWKDPTVKPKPARKVYPLVNFSFLNTAGNNATLKHNFGKRLPTMVRHSVAGKPGIVGFCEVSSEQEPTLTTAMRAKGYFRLDYDHMLAVFHRGDVLSEGHDFERYDDQDGGTTEGLLRFKVRVNGTALQGGLTHLDHDSSWSKKKANLRQAVSSLERFGVNRLGDQWRERTVLFGDFNATPEAVASVLEPLGFKLAYADSIDQFWVGEKRATRGGASTKTESDHKRNIARLGKYTK